MRGRDDRDRRVCSATCGLEERVPADHPLRAIRALADEALAALNGRLRGAVLGDGPALDPAGDAAAGDAVAGVLLGALRADADGADRLQPAVPLVRRAADGRARSGIRRCSRTTATGCWRRMWRGSSWRALMGLPRVKRLLSSEHFSVDGTLIDAWASMKSFRPKDGSGEPPAPGRNGERNFRKEKRSNETHASTTDPGRAALPQGRWPREPAVLHGACPDGEPQRAGDRRHAHPRHRHGGARGDADDARPARDAATAITLGRRQGL